MSASLEYLPTTMTVTWKAYTNGRVHVRKVDLGSIRGDADFVALATLNVGRRGSVLSHSIERAA